MPLCIQDQFALPPYLKVQLLSAIFSVISYGIVIVLSGNCVYLLQKKRGIYSNRMRTLLLICVTIMVLSSTWALIRSIFQLRVVFTRLHASVLYRSFGVPLTMTMWGADGFMVRTLILCQEQRFTMHWQLQIWRCLVLYQDVSKGPRIVIIVLFQLFHWLLLVSQFLVPLPPIQLAHKILSMRYCGVSLTSDIRV
jgi:hypothetical protein